MPQIPTYTASGKAAEQDYPRDVPVESFEGLAQAGGQLQKIGQQTGQIAGNLDALNKRAQAEAAKSEFKIGQGDYDALVRDAKEEINKDPLIVDADRAEKAFIFREKAIREKVSNNLTLPAAKNAFAEHARQNYLGSVVDAKTIGVKKASDYAVGQLDKLKIATVNNASQTVSLADFEKELNNYENSLTSMRDQGLITARVYEDRKITATKDAFNARADVLINKDPELFMLVKARGDFNNMNRQDLAAKIEKADAEFHQRSVRIDQATTKMKQKEEEDWAKDVMAGKSITERITRARAGLNPFMTDPDTILKYEKMSINPPTTAFDASVRLLKQNYRAEFVINPSEAVIDKYAKVAVGQQTDRPNNELSIFMNELASDKGQLRGLQAQGFADFNRTLAGEINLLKREQLGSPRYDARQKKLDEADEQKLKAAAYDAWSSSRSPEEMRKILLEKSAELKKQRSDDASRGKTKKQEDEGVLYGDR